MLIPRSGEGFLDRTLHVLLVDQTQLTVAKSLCTTCLTSPLWSRKWLPLVASSHIQSYTIAIIDLIGLYMWSIVSSPLVIIIFIGGLVTHLVIQEAILL